MATITGASYLTGTAAPPAPVGMPALPGIPVVLQNLDTGHDAPFSRTRPETMPFFTSPPERTAWSSSLRNRWASLPRRFLRRGGRACPCGRQSPHFRGPQSPGRRHPSKRSYAQHPVSHCDGGDIGEQTFLSGPVIYSPIETILDPCAAVSEETS